MGHWKCLTKKITKDLQKVQFDFENTIIDDDTDNLYGLHTMENGLTFCGIGAGGDWEYPVFFIIYYDGKDLRAYIPTKGNPWNTDFHEAYGNHGEDEYENIQGNPDRDNWTKRTDLIFYGDGVIWNPDQIKKEISRNFKLKE
jgi:hypothetical protein